MTVSYVSAGTAVYDDATSPLAVGFPASVAAGLKAIMLVGQKPSTANSGSVTPPSGWTNRGQLAGAGGYGATLGADTGNTNIYVLELDTLTAGTEGGTTVSLVHATTNVLWARIILVSSDSTTFEPLSIVTGSDTTAGSVSVAFGSNPGFTAGDLALWAMCIPTDVTTPSQFSTHAISATGATFGTATEIGEFDSATNNDIGGYAAYAAVTAGTASGNPTVTATAGGTTTNVRGPMALVRLRSAAPPPNAAPTITSDPSNATDILDATGRTFSVSATGLPTPTLQWEQNTGSGWTNVTGGSGGTTNTYTAPTSTAALNGIQYRCVATNTEGSDTSLAATWTIIPFRRLTQSSSTTDGTTFNGASITVGQNRLGTVNITSQGVNPTDRQAPDTVSIGAHALTKIDEQIISTFSVVSSWRCLDTAADITGTLTIGFTLLQDTVSWGAGEWEGPDTTGTNGSGAVHTPALGTGTGTAMSVASIADPGAAGVWVQGNFGWSDASSAAVATHTAPAGLAEASESSAADSSWYSAQAISVGLKATSVAGTLSSSETWGGIAFVIKAQSSSTLLKSWNGTSWIEKPVKVWDGAVWTTKPMKRWNGVSWV